MALPLPLKPTYTYRVPVELGEEAQTGSRVQVPFGHRRLTGVIVEKSEPVDGFDGDFELKDVTRALDEDQPALTEELLRLTRWMADYYVCSWGEAIKAALPPGGTDATPKRQFGLRLAPAHRTPEAARGLKAEVRGTKQKATLDALAAFLEEKTDTPLQAEVRRRAEAPASTIQSLIAKGMVEQVEREVHRSPFDGLTPPPDPPNHALTTAQAQTMVSIKDAIGAERYETFLLHGVTGSGKTEVYISALKETLACGRTGIILVPEIALTPQTVRRFRAHLGDEVAVLHSQLSTGERYDTWRGLREGRFRVAIGPRSAVLAPLQDLGLIVVDEEHESSYKQFDPAPRYHARDVAVMRASMNGAACVLGSATPSLESLANARRGKYTLLELPERVPVKKKGSGTKAVLAAAELPEMQLVDLTRERKKHRLDGALSVPLRKAIEERLRRGEQAILLQNRRGYAPVIECDACGWSPTCTDCAVTLTYHKPKRHLRCHYCGHARSVPRRCPSCGDEALARLGTGTQRVEEELAGVFPEAGLLRMDRDTTSRKGAHRRLLRRFGDGEADILLGTQMIAKGLDFGRVTLVGVVNADVGLLLPDFRAEERTFQLLMQVAGRAGRAGRPGQVLLQTRNPEHPALQHALDHDYDGFTRQLLAERRLLGYPPFGRLVSLEFRGPEHQRAEALAKGWTAALREQAGAVEVLGPEPAVVQRIKGRHRFRTLVKVARSYSARAAGALLRSVQEAQGRPPNGYHVSIDVDAVGLL